MGGGEHKIEVTADLIAVAVIAAATTYGDDPAWALTVPSGKPRRCLAPAIHGLAVATGRHAKEFYGPLRVPASTVSARQKLGDAAFVKASTAAVNAVLSRHPPKPPAPVAEVAPPPMAPKLRTLTAKAVREAIRDVLHTDNATAPELAGVLRLAEAAVRQGLRELAELGEARADPMTAEGWRVQTWRWVPKAPA